MADRPVAFVTGASRGIGRGIVIELARNGFDIVGNATSYDSGDRRRGLAETQERVKELGCAFEPAPGDISDLACHGQLLEIACARFGQVDLLVNNAGVSLLERKDFLETTPESYDRVLGINLRGTFFLSQCFAKHMVNSTGGNSNIHRAIVFITSISVDTSSPSRTEYCVSKAGLSHLSRILAHRLAGLGISVFEVRPGLINTDMTAGMKDTYDALIADGLIPDARWGTPEDVGRAVAALARGDFGYSTGGVFDVSGGMNIKRL